MLNDQNLYISFVHNVIQDVVRKSTKIDPANAFSDDRI